MAQQKLPNEDKSVALTEIVAKNCVLSPLTHLSSHMPRGAYPQYDPQSSIQPMKKPSLYPTPFGFSTQTINPP